LVFFGFDNHDFECFASKYPPIPLIKQIHPVQSRFFLDLGLDFFGVSRIFSKKIE
jgi:hypothetical protein